MHMLQYTASQVEGTTTDERKNVIFLPLEHGTCMSLCTGSCSQVLWIHCHPPELTSPGFAKAVHSDTEDLGEQGPCRRGREHRGGAF